MKIVCSEIKFIRKKFVNQNVIFSPIKMQSCCVMFVRTYNKKSSSNTNLYLNDNTFLKLQLLLIWNVIEKKVNKQTLKKRKKYTSLTFIECVERSIFLNKIKLPWYVTKLK